jgi:cold-inducible RNA-binding protein
MSRKVFVGNLPWAMTESDLSQHLSDLDLSFESVKVIMNRDTGRSRGFAFVELSTDAEASRAIEVLNGRIVDGRVLCASEARQRESQRLGSKTPDGQRPEGQRPEGQRPEGGGSKGRGEDRRRDSGLSTNRLKEYRSKGRGSRSSNRGESSGW